MEINFWKNKQVFVTGSIGFLGSWLIKKLVELNANVVVLIGDDDPRSNFYKFKLNEKVISIKGYVQDHTLLKKILNTYSIDIVFHLAAQPIVTIANKDPFDTFESNIRGTYNLLESCRNNDKIKAIIVASSDKAYGSHEKLPYVENDALKGEYPYDVSKSCTDLISNCYFKTYKLPIVITRCGNFYGGGDYNLNRIIPDTIITILKNKQPIIRSDGTFIRDYIYVKDVVDAYITLAENIKNEKVVGNAFNISTERKYNVLEVVNLILELMNSDLKPIILNQANGEIKNQFLSGEKIKKTINWTPKYNLNKGLTETIEWYKETFKNKEY